MSRGAADGKNQSHALILSTIRETRMKRLSLFVALLLFAGSTAAQTPPAMVTQLLPYIWRVDAHQYSGGTSSGTGVMIAPEKIITDCHVTAGAFNIVVTNAATGKSLYAGREAYDIDSDLCLLVVPNSGDKAVHLDTDDSPAPGTPVFTVGYPLRQLSYSTGKVLSEHELYGVPVIDTTVGCNHGNSGGPLFNEQGALIGLTAFIHKNIYDCNVITGDHIPMMLDRVTMQIQAGLGNDWFEERGNPRN